MQVMRRGGRPEEEEVKKYFSDTNYYMVLVRKNGLPERFTMKQKYELFSIRQEQIIMYGRDVQEGLYLYPEEILTRPFRFRVEEIAEKYRDGISYITVVASEKSYSIEHVAGVIPLFYRTIAERTVVGKSQILFLENLQEKHVTTEKEPDYLPEILRFLRTNKKDIAYMVGYTDQFYFSRVFHSVAGLTPTEYVLNQ